MNYLIPRSLRGTFIYRRTYSKNQFLPKELLIAVHTGEEKGTWAGRFPYYRSSYWEELEVQDSILGEVLTPISETKTESDSLYFVFNREKTSFIFLNNIFEIELSTYFTDFQKNTETFESSNVVNGHKYVGIRKSGIRIYIEPLIWDSKEIIQLP